MSQKSKQSIDERFESLLDWLKGRIESLEQDYLQENVIEATSEELFDLESFSSRKDIVKKKLSKYIEIKNEIEFCIALRKQVTQEYGDYLKSQGQQVHRRPSLGNHDLDSIPDPNLWEE
ncbi:hypothetical protein [Nostoc sp. FACHB-110]|uniref:hypothetical protein n=1 Tax=Nostoc sp. FACHB-110 TaxID=2692834 RepID=UPI001688CE34|nr:hypothetical protein [Nostoc sp. FACHB-110]MBD2437251.1 hypothetical protein [Nostoc sp. FACHB-110]